MLSVDKGFPTWLLNAFHFCWFKYLAWKSIGISHFSSHFSICHLHDVLHGTQVNILTTVQGSLNDIMKCDYACDNFEKIQEPGAIG